MAKGVQHAAFTGLVDGAVWGEHFSEVYLYFILSHDSLYLCSRIPKERSLVVLLLEVLLIKSFLYFFVLF